MKKKLFVIDTNVLMHDPTALFRFEEHDLYLPMIVIEELDNNKKGLSEVARNVRQVSRFLDDLILDAKISAIQEGLPLVRKHHGTNNPHGRLFFQTHDLSAPLPQSLPINKSDHQILETLQALKAERPRQEVILVSKDINLRIKARLLGLEAQDYFNDQVMEDIEYLPTGQHILAPDFWEKHGDQLTSWKERDKTFYRIQGQDLQQWKVNEFLSLPEDEGFSAVVRQIEPREVLVELITDYTHQHHAIWGITARNREQNFALNLLMDPDIDFVSLQGIAGTGKTLLALAAGLAQTMEQKIYREILVTRVTVPLGEDIGFLPGTEEEKMTPWMGALMDNLEVLHSRDNRDENEYNAGQALLKNRIKIRSLNFMRGRTFLNKYIIIDEAQNLTSKQMKTLITRAGPGTKIVCLGDIKQIDTPYITETNSGFTYAIDRFQGWAHGGHITLTRGERSRLADYAAEHL